MNQSHIINGTFFVLNSTIIVYFNLVKSDNQLVASQIIISMQTEMNQPPISIEIPIIQMSVGTNLIIHEIYKAQIQFYQLILLHITSFSTEIRSTYQTNKFFYDTIQGLIEITTFNIQPTINFIINATFNGLKDYTISQLWIGDILFENTNCTSLNQIIQSKIYIICDLSNVGFSTQQYLANLIQDNFIPVKYTAINKIYQVTTAIIETQLIDIDQFSCVQEPHISLNQNSIIINFNVIQNYFCINDMTNITVTIGFVNQSISKSYKILPQLTPKSQISFNIDLNRFQFKTLYNMNQNQNLTILTIHQFIGKQAKTYNTISREYITSNRLIITTMKFSTKNIKLVYEFSQIQANMTVLVHFLIDTNILADIYLSAIINFQHTSKIIFQNRNILQHYNQKTYIPNPTIQDIYNKIINSNSITAIVEGGMEVQTINNFINVHQYINPKFLTIITLLIGVQIISCSVFFSLSNREY